MHKTLGSCCRVGFSDTTADAHGGKDCPEPLRLLSEPFRPRRWWAPIPNSSTRFARLVVEPYRSLVTRKSSRVFWQLLPAWRPIPLLARSLFRPLHYRPNSPNVVGIE